MGAATISNPSPNGSLPAAFAALFLAPLFLSSNMVFGRAVLSVEPFTLAALRWSITALILLLLCHGQIKTLIDTLKRNVTLLLSCGFFGFWVCGGVVYLALHTTSATNGILIYTTPPLLVMGIEAIFRGRAIRLRELLGIAFAIAGVFVIVLRGEFANLARLDFNPGDLMFVAASFSWAVYTVMLKSKSLAHLGTLPLLTLVSCCGAVWLIPFAAYEIATTGNFPVTGYEWGIIAGIVLVCLACFLCELPVWPGSGWRIGRQHLHVFACPLWPVSCLALFGRTAAGFSPFGNCAGDGRCGARHLSDFLSEAQIWPYAGLIGD